MSKTIARTEATGGAMLPELVKWSSSIEYDRQFVREDILGSLAHLQMLKQTKIVPTAIANRLKQELISIYRSCESNQLVFTDEEEDVHMAVEKLLYERIGDDAGYLHAARSRNDQVALDLRLYCRERGRRIWQQVLALVSTLLARAEAEKATYLPSFTHRQRAQPVSAALYFGAWATALLRANRHIELAIEEANVSPLGAGANSGTSLPIDREISRQLLQFSSVSTNALDTIGDRDFAIDLVLACNKLSNGISRISQDVIDFSSQEFGYIKLDGEIAAGSSMMPQKKNPDIFELLRAKSAAAVSQSVHMLSLTRALPTGYNRDLQEDRRALFASTADTAASIDVLTTAIAHLHFDREKCLAALASGFTQATDLAEALVTRGTPFREAYRKSGEFVAQAMAGKKTLAEQVPAELRAVLDAQSAADAKESTGGTGKQAIEKQLLQLKTEVAQQSERAAAIPALDNVARQLLI